jgi:hypothetical protein
VAWHGDYGTAMQSAKQAGKMMFIYFHDNRAAEDDNFAKTVLADADVGKSLNRYVCVKLPVTTAVTIDQKQTKLLDHAAFAELQHKAGVAIIDLLDPTSQHFGHVVSVFPFTDGLHLNRSRLVELLNLPPGSLTQRTLIFAVRTHPENPQSADGALYPVLATAAEDHSEHQAGIMLQGHHNWDSRFHRINSQLPGAMMAQEVCAESWRGQGLVSAAIECVHSWRQSPGHWSAVRGRHALFGYDMQRGRNGVWYATGIFARR